MWKTDMMITMIGLLPLTLLYNLTVSHAAQFRHPGEGTFEVSSHGRYGWLPDSMLDILYTHHANIHGLAPGVEVAWVKGGFHLLATGSMLKVTTEDSVWQEKGVSMEEAEWVEPNLTLWDANLAFCYEFPIASWVRIMPGMGWGAVFVKGELTSYPTTGEAGGDIDSREKLADSSGEPLQFPRRFYAQSILLNARFYPTDHWVISIENGLRMYLYSGLSVGYQF